MISVVLYGRNDAYGYNLHKRAALSLNCVAEVLTDSSDEILFVDYNTPDDFPTFPEAIQDTLTPRAKELLRIFRVRPRIHERFRSKTRLLALEPIARNVAIRRSSESNRWILSTNTDMIVVPLHSPSLSRVAQDLAPGFYHTPRIEIPEILWESLNRGDPVGIIKTVRMWGSSLHLNEIVQGSRIILYDGPGDFQLLLRSDLFENRGFDERMLLGWHVDSNIAARMHVKYGRVGDLGSEIYGYHCDHTRQVTPAHSHAALQNDWRRFVTDIAESSLPHQTETWGCIHDQIEEIHLPKRPATSYLEAIRDSVGNPLEVPMVVRYSGETYNKVEYDPQHLLPFLADLFAPAPRDTDLAWYGFQSKMLMAFVRVWEKLGFTGKILVDSPELHFGAGTDSIKQASTLVAMTDANVLLFDFGGLPFSDEPGRTELSAQLRKSFLRVVRSERERLLSGMTPRRIIALNAINNDHEVLVGSFIAAAATPFSTHMRHGFVIPAAKEEWLPLLMVGEAGVRVGAKIESNPIRRGWVAYGPRKYLDVGRYVVTLNVKVHSDDLEYPETLSCISIEICAGSQIIALSLLRYGDLTLTKHRMAFNVSEEVAGVAGIDIRIAALTSLAFALCDLSLESASSLHETRAHTMDVLNISDWLPYLRIGPLGSFNEKGVSARTGPPGFIVYGPYWSLPAGRYELKARIENVSDTPQAEHLVRADVAVGDRQLAVGNFQLSALSSDTASTAKWVRLRFDLEGLTPEARQIETRIWSSGEERFTITSLSIKRLQQQEAENLLPLLLIGEAGRRFGGDIRTVEKRVGFVAYSPTILLTAGAYKLSYTVAIQKAPSTEDRDNDSTCAMLIVRQGPYVLSVEAINWNGGSKNTTFAIAHSPIQPDPVEFLLQVVTPADVRLRALSIEPVVTAVPTNQLAALRIENWLPFMQRQPGIISDQGGFLVDERSSGFAFWGPYWTLPAGRYEIVALVAPHASELDGKPLVTLDVTSEGGQRLIAQHGWYIGQIRPEDLEKAIECRLPFDLCEDLPARSRTIETRISTLGGGRFHIRSLRAQPFNAEQERDLFPYLTVRECGVRTCNAIESLKSKSGCIACTPPLFIESGRYEAHMGIADAHTTKAANDGEIVLQAQSGLDILGIGVSNVEPGLCLTKVVTFEIPRSRAGGSKIELRIQAISSVVGSISALRLTKTGDTAPPRVGSRLRNEQWTEHFHLDALGRGTSQGIVAKAGLGGAVGHLLAPYRTGRCEIVLRVKRMNRRADATGQLTVSAGSVVLASRSFDLHPFIPLPRGSFRFCSFDAPANLARETATLWVRIDNTGPAPFLIKSITLAPRTRLGQIRDFAYLMVRKILIRLGGVFAPK